MEENQPPTEFEDITIKISVVSRDEAALWGREPGGSWFYLCSLNRQQMFDLRAWSLAAIESMLMREQEILG